MTDRRDAALVAIAPYRQRPLGHFVAGRDLPGVGTLFDVIEPGTGEVLGQARDATFDELNAAVASAKKAFEEWSRTSGDRRKAILHKVADLIEARAEEIAGVECLDAGQCWRFMSKAAIRGAKNFRFFADRAPSASDGQSLPTSDHLNYTTRTAIGPVGVITPWNYALHAVDVEDRARLSGGMYRRA